LDFLDSIALFLFLNIFSSVFQSHFTVDAPTILNPLYVMGNLFCSRGTLARWQFFVWRLSVHSVDRGRQHVVERLTQDDIGTNFVERDVGQQPITLSLRQAGRTCGLQSWWLFGLFITWEMTQVSTSRPDANFSVMHNSAGQRRCFEHWHICLPHFPPRHQSKQKSQLTEHLI